MKGNFRQQQATCVKQMDSLLLWAPSLSEDIHVAACFDDGTVSDSDLLTTISAAERQQVSNLDEASERRHFAFRRSFQRMFLATIIDWHGPPSELQIQHKRNSPPCLKEEPSLCISFSSSGLTALACASFSHQVGIDIEKIRPLGNSLGLAQRFFTDSEAKSLSHLAENDMDLAFLHFWTAKEAGLKAEGKGIDSGLHRFPIVLHNGSYHIEYKEEKNVLNDWNLMYTDFLPNHIVAVMHRRRSLP